MSRTPHSVHHFVIITLLLVVVTSVSIIGIGLDSPQITLAQQQQPQANVH
jgi:hypothetical protein